jgi:DNA-binding GntR family transcriptional regulator
MARIIRQPLRSDVRRVLLGRLLSGELEPGSQINEAKLASELGVSRTPLREALIHLEFEGFIESVQGKGFSVAPLRAQTVRELHALVGLLEGQAMRALHDLDQNALEELITELEAINAELEKEVAKGPGQDPERLITLGNNWHAVLVSASTNEQLHEILQLLRQRMYRYTYGFLTQRQRVPERLTQHAQIMEALRDRQIERAIEMVENHWIRHRRPSDSVDHVG